MREIFLIFVVIAVFLFGYVIVRKVDQEIWENEKHMEEEIKRKEPSAVRLSGDMPLMEIDKEIEQFRENHEDFEIILREKSGIM